MGVLESRAFLDFLKISEQISEIKKKILEKIISWSKASLKLNLFYRMK